MGSFPPPPKKKKHFGGVNGLFLKPNMQNIQAVAILKKKEKSLYLSSRLRFY